ncbi:hypothetical protein PCE01_15420 [Pediococcus cellicola]|nr:hypothetical protein PCE01_15420 [Pediococcus cellicola]
MTKSKKKFKKTIALKLNSGYNGHCKEVGLAYVKHNLVRFSKEEKIWLLYILHRVVLLAEKHVLG